MISPRLVLTIVAHPDTQRIGERVELIADGLDRRIDVSRGTPEFRTPAGHLVGPLGDRYISRTPLVCSVSDGWVTFEPRTHATIRINGERLTAARRVPAPTLTRGVTIDFADRVALLLHTHAGGPDLSPKYGMIGESDPMQEIRRKVGAIAGLEVPVLILGATGTGKELVARAIHAASARAAQRYIAINVAALSPEVAVAELFGHARGSFTGAVQSRPGLFREADGGTIFLDEIGEAPVEVQVMLLRVLESGEIQPLGGAPSRRVDVRVIAASDVDLAAAMLRGGFRSSLFHRLAGYTIATPTLRSRVDDIPRLLAHFLAHELQRSTPRASFGEPLAPPLVHLRASQIVRLLRYPWPGNIRELGNVARRLVATALAGGDNDSVIDDLVGEGASTELTPKQSIVSTTTPPQISDQALIAALREHDWQLAATARHLGIARNTLDLRIKRCAAIRRPRDLERDELTEVYQRSGGDIGAMAAALGVSVRGLQLRLKELNVR